MKMHVHGKGRLLLSCLFLTFGPGAGHTRETLPENLGKVLFLDRCAACHLQDGMGIREMNAPSIAGLPRWYVTDQLRKFRRDERGFHEEDTSGHLMQANAAALDERSIAFLGKHVENLDPNPERNTLGTSPTADGRELYRYHCAECHGEQGEGDRGRRTPPLTSQQDWYLLHQMENFQSGRRIHHDSTPSPVSEKELEAVIAWISRPFKK